MYLTGGYDSTWLNNLYLRNTATTTKSCQIDFFDEKGGKIYEIKQIEINPYGMNIVNLQDYKELESQKGLFIIWADSGIKGEHYISAYDGAPLRTIKALDEGLPPFNSRGLSIFISYSMKDENENLYGLISRFVKTIGFSVLSAKESGRMELPPGTQITDMISESHAMIAILTKDIHPQNNTEELFYPSHNVIDEIGQASKLPVILLVEEGTKVPSNIETRSTYIQFSKNNYGEMLVNLMENMKNSGFA